MRRALYRFVMALFVFAAALSATSSVALADATCPGNVVIMPGSVACHLIGPPDDCKHCKYKCDDGQTYEVNMCAAE